MHAVRRRRHHAHEYRGPDPGHHAVVVPDRPAPAALRRLRRAGIPRGGGPQVAARRPVQERQSPAVVPFRLADGTRDRTVRELRGAVFSRHPAGHAVYRLAAAAYGHAHRPALLHRFELVYGIRLHQRGRRGPAQRGCQPANPSLRGPGDEGGRGACGTPDHGGAQGDGALRHHHRGRRVPGRPVPAHEGRDPAPGHALARHAGPASGLRKAFSTRTTEGMLPAQGEVPRHRTWNRLCNVPCEHISIWRWGCFAWPGSSPEPSSAPISSMITR